MLRPLVNSLRRRWLQFRGAAGLESPRQLGAAIEIRPGFGEKGAGKIQIGAAAWIECGVLLHAFGGHIQLGDNLFLGPYSVIYGHGGVAVGDDTLISMHCRILSSNHTIPPLGVTIRSQPDALLPTKIGRDVWLGAGVTILGGVTVGDGCVVGAGSVVTRDLPPGTVAAGAPATVLRTRGAAP